MSINQRLEDIKEKYRQELRLIRAKSDRTSTATLKIMLDGQAGLISRMLDDLDKLDPV